MDTHINFYTIVAQVIPVIILSLVVDNIFTKPSSLKDNWPKILTVVPQLLTLFILFCAEFVSLRAIWTNKSDYKDLNIIIMAFSISGLLLLFLTYKRLINKTTNSGMEIFFIITNIVTFIYFLFK